MEPNIFGTLQQNWLHRLHLVGPMSLLSTFYFTSTEARWLIRDGDGGGGGGGRKSEGSTADTARKRPERPWRLAIAQQ